jgi:hypothetical protein
MRTPIRELSGPGIAGGLTAATGVAVWRLGIEFERAWLRSCDGGPLSGDTYVCDRPAAPLHMDTGLTATSNGGRRRWVTTATRQQRSTRGAARSR